MADRDDCVCGTPHPREACPVLARALKAFGPGAVIGLNKQYPGAPLYVGKTEKGTFKLFGAGKSWEEAFENVKKVEFQYPGGRFKFVEEKKDANQR